MQAFTDGRNDDTADEIWLLEHPPVFTLGQAATRDHVLAPGDIPLVQVDRGGQVTYHGPGQAVLYPLWDLKRRGIGIKQLVDWLEQSVINWLQQYGVEAQRRQKAPGVYVGEEKIASLGLRVRRGCTFHGMAVNVKMDLEPFQRINPCGYQGLTMTQSAALGISDGWQQAGQKLIAQLTQLSGHRTTTKEAACA
ncbi:MAG: lipoyl(octanoyl) transferase LipB [Lysobacterales bacterium]